jgi:ACS family glucarate transporter-like MFS transporter
MFSSFNRKNPTRGTIVGMLTGLSLVNYIARSNISVAAKFIKPEFGLTDIQMGQIFSSFLVGYSLFQIPAGRLGDRFGPRIVLAIAAFCWGLTTLLTGLIPGVLMTGTVAVIGALFVVRFLLGVGEAATYPVSARAIANWMPPSERARSNSLVIAGGSIGSAFTPPLVSWLMVHLGWRQSFYLTSLLGFGIAAIWWFKARDYPAGARPLLAGQREAKDSISWWSLFRNRNVVLLSVSYFVTGYVLYIFVFWLYTYLVDVRKFSVLGGGVYSSLPWIAAIILAPVGGALSDSFTRRWGARLGRRAVACGGLTLSAIALFYGATVANPYLAIVGLAFAVGFEYFTEGTFWASTSNVAGPHAGAATGILNTMGNFGGIASTVLIPVLVKYFGWVVALGSGSVLAVLGGLLWFAIDLKGSE